MLFVAYDRGRQGGAGGYCGPSFGQDQGRRRSAPSRSAYSRRRDYEDNNNHILHTLVEAVQTLSRQGSDGRQTHEPAPLGALETEVWVAHALTVSHVCLITGVYTQINATRNTPKTLREKKNSARHGDITLTRGTTKIRDKRMTTKD